MKYLKTGRNGQPQPSGPMGEAVENSTSKMSDADLKAIAVYLKDLPASRSNAAPGRPAARVAEAGEAIYVDTCSACHQQKGEGVPSMFPALAGDPNVQSDNPATVIRLILNGGHAAATDQRPTPVSMPDYGWKLSDAEVAAVASYIRSAWATRRARFPPPTWPGCARRCRTPQPTIDGNLPRPRVSGRKTPGGMPFGVPDAVRYGSLGACHPLATSRTRYGPKSNLW